MVARDALDVYLAFASIGAIILVGFGGSLLFEKTKISDIPILIFIGLLLGPIAAATFNITLINHDMLSKITPYFASLALVIILFDGGLNLNFEKVMDQLGIAAFHSILTFGFSMVSTALIAYYLLGYGIFACLLLGCIIGGISGAVVIPLVSMLNIKEDTMIILTLESVLTDVLCIIVAISLIEVIKGTSIATGSVIGDLLGAFFIAGGLGLMMGIVWLEILTKLYGKPFAFMITIGALFMLYAGVEYIGASGAFAALVFGLVLSNKEEFMRIFKIEKIFVLDAKIKQFHSELSFLVRTFFFVYLGMVFTLHLQDLEINPNGTLPDIITTLDPLILFLGAVVLIFVGIIMVRYIISGFTTIAHKDIKEDRSILWKMMPRGLASAVLASMLLTIPEFEPELAYQFLNIVFMVLILTVIATTIGVFTSERRKEEKEAEPKEKWHRDLEKEKIEFDKRVRERRKELDQKEIGNRSLTRKIEKEERRKDRLEKKRLKHMEMEKRYREKVQNKKKWN